MFPAVSKPPILCLMGPTAAGKTPLAVELVQRYPLSIISVDSAMVYRDMNIGTAKPSADILKIAPHRLIDFLDPKEIYSVARFCQDALGEIQAIQSQGKIPLLVGGTMMYFRVLQQGFAALPPADAKVRAALKDEAKISGWEVLHGKLQTIDPEAAQRIQPNDSQRIQRALEVYLTTGKTISTFQGHNTKPLSDYRIFNVALIPRERTHLHKRIAKRFDEMLANGLIDEVKQLYARGDLTKDLPALRTVGYREVWDFLEGNVRYEEMRDKAIIATRQLAKRQLTWLRSWPDVVVFDSDAFNVLEQVMEWVGNNLSKEEHVQLLENNPKSN